MKIHVFESICKILNECYRVSTFNTANPSVCESLTYFDCDGRKYPVPQ